MLTFLLDILFPPKENTLLARKATPEALARARTPREINPHIFAVFPFEDPLIRALIHEMKYRGSKNAPQLLAEAAAPALAEFLAERQVFEEFTEPLIVPLPLHTRKIRERGFNQSERLAQALITEGLFTENALVSSALTRIRYTESQTLLRGTRARRENVRGAFTVPEKMQGLVHGRDVIVIDDVITSGATLREARAALKERGARNVLSIAIAYA